MVYEGFVLSGIEVEVSDREWTGGDGPRASGKEPRVQTLFLSRAEIIALMEALGGPLRLYRDQLDWAHDWT